MKKALFITLLVASLLAITACAKPAMEVKQGSSGDAVFIVIKDKGISSDTSEVVVTNLYAGAKAEMTYRIHNATAKAIMPEIYLVKGANIADYSKANGAVKAPDNIGDWLKLPALSDIPPGQIKDFVVALEMPKGIKKPANKIGFQVGVSGKTVGTIQPAVGTWWLVSMR